MLTKTQINLHYLKETESTQGNSFLRCYSTQRIEKYFRKRINILGLKSAPLGNRPISVTLSHIFLSSPFQIVMCLLTVMKILILRQMNHCGNHLTAKRQLWVQCKVWGVNYFNVATPQQDKA